MTDETAEYGRRLRDLEAFAFRTRGALAEHGEHGEQRANVRERPRTASGGPEDRAIEQRLGTIERVLFALARAQGIDPESTG